MRAVQRSARGEARRRQIIEGALSAIRKQPVADVPLASIAEHAGLKPSHVLYYFPSRDDVLIAAVEHAERELAAGRTEELRGISDPERRLMAYVQAYLPGDRDDPVWKLWIEGWLRSASRAEFGAIGRQASLGWRTDLEEAVAHALGARAPSQEALSAFARRFNFALDGIAIHVLAGHVAAREAADMAMATLKPQLHLGGAGEAHA
jgi:AcrR family transcriptional regulator